jgi:hypothetical protein
MQSPGLVCLVLPDVLLRARADEVWMEGVLTLVAIQAERAVPHYPRTK